MVHLNSSKPLLRPGYRGIEVEELQKLLAHWDVPIERSSDIYNVQLERAVKTFQRRMFLPVDGVVGPETWDALFTGAPINMPTLQQGRSGRAVRLLQEALLSEGSYQGELDGIFGPQTDRAVRSFQSRYGLITDGTVGSCTWRALSKIDRLSPSHL